MILHGPRGTTKPSGARLESRPGALPLTAERGHSLHAEVARGVVWLACCWAGIVGVPGAFGRAYGDITFFIGSDAHYGCTNPPPTPTCDVIAEGALDRMNALPGQPYPGSLGGGTVDTPRGVLLIGDLTELYAASQWSSFTNDWGLTGERRLAFPVYEGYGNHDDPSTLIKQSIIARNLLRPNVSNISSNGYHYSWDWDYLHLVCLNLCPGTQPVLLGHVPNDSLPFLAYDLASRVGNSGKPVIIYHHYGFDSFSYTWWPDTARSNYFEIIKNYNVLAIFAGHNHLVDRVVWNGIATYNDGTLGKFTGNFLVVHLAGNRLTVAERTPTNTWGQSWTQIVSITNAPSIVVNPQSISAPVGSSVSLSVQAIGSSLTYQWLFGGANAIPGATNSTLNLSPVQFGQSGTYDVLVSNGAGSVTSAPAALTVLANLDVKAIPVLGCTAEIGTVLDLEYADTLAYGGNWLPLATVMLTNTPQSYADISALGQPRRYYRAYAAPCQLNLSVTPGVLIVHGNPGDVVRLEYQDAASTSSGLWLQLETVTLTNASQFYVDLSAWGQPPRSYRAVGVSGQ